MVLLPSAKARSWAKVKIAKHLFEHRYDYRTEWLRFTEHGRASAEPMRAPLGERVIKAFADILEAPGGLLLVDRSRRARSTTGVVVELAGQASARRRARAEVRDFWLSVGIERPDHRARRAAQRLGRSPRTCARLPPQWMLRGAPAWTGVPLIHDERLVGLILLAAPDYRRAARLGGFRPAAHRRPPGGERACRSAWPGSAVERAAVRGIQPPLRLHPARHQESGQPAVAAVAQCRAACRQSRVPRRHGRDSAKLGRQDERAARPPFAPGAGALATIRAAAAALDPGRRNRCQAPRP